MTRPSGPCPLLLYVALGFVFFGSLLLAAQFYPHPYDWRRDVMSRLAEPRFNPRAYLIACTGLALGGLLLMPFAARAPSVTRRSGWILYLAAGTLTLAGLVPGHVPALGGAHEILAHAYGVAISFAMVGYFAAALRLPRDFIIQRLAGIILIVIPLSGFVLSRLSLWFGDRLVTPAVYAAIKSSPWNRLALWEWIAGVGTYLFLGLLLTLPENVREKAR
jgi:hypothetical protein